MDIFMVKQKASSIQDYAFFVFVFFLPKFRWLDNIINRMHDIHLSDKKIILNFEN